jgi:four helix bundle protein
VEPGVREGICFFFRAVQLLPFDMGDFAKLHVWRKAHALALNVHTVAIRIRGSNYVSLRSQMIRAAMSIPANIVEGRGQKSERDFGRFLGYALNSSSELEYHLVVGRDIRAITLGDFTSLLAQLIEVRKMLHGLLKRVNAAVAVPSAAE